MPARADSRLETMKSIYAGEMDKIVAQHVDDMKHVNKAYSAYLAGELKKDTNKGELEAYRKIEQEKQRFKKENTIPAD